MQFVPATMRVIDCGDCDSCLQREVPVLRIVGAINRNVCTECLKTANGVVAEWNATLNPNPVEA